MTRGIAAERHALDWQGETRLDAGGRRLKVCAACGQIAVGTSHLPKAGLWPGSHARAKVAESAARPPETADTPRNGQNGHHPPSRPPKVARIAGKPTGRPGKYLETPWQVRMLAIALDRALVAGPEVTGYAVYLHAGSLRAVIDLPAELEPDAPPLAVDQAEPVVPVEPNLEKPRRNEIPAWVTVPRDERARARSLTKGIRHDRMRDLATRAITLGAYARKNGSGHLILSGGPLTAPLSVSMTSSGLGRAWPNLRAEASRKGLDTSGL